MFRVLLLSWMLRRARRDHPELFDGALALASIEAALAEHTALRNVRIANCRSQSA